jgi:hypothetical protein
MNRETALKIWAPFIEPKSVRGGDCETCEEQHDDDNDAKPQAVEGDAVASYHPL